jgi:hypothetical protein
MALDDVALAEQARRVVLAQAVEGREPVVPELGERAVDLLPVRSVGSETLTQDVAALRDQAIDALWNPRTDSRLRGC